LGIVIGLILVSGYNIYPSKGSHFGESLAVSFQSLSDFRHDFVCFSSYLITLRGTRQESLVSAPRRGCRFVCGIFLAMIPALLISKLRARRCTWGVLAIVGWRLSSFLDNAPTYLLLPVWQKGLWG
jgi:hypothetical protein